MFALLLKYDISSIDREIKERKDLGWGGVGGKNKPVQFPPPPPPPPPPQLRIMYNNYWFIFFLSSLYIGYSQCYY